MDRQMLKILPKAVTSWMNSLSKKEEFRPGIVTVIHNFGIYFKWNQHVHIMVTEGGKGNITE